MPHMTNDDSPDNQLTRTKRKAQSTICTNLNLKTNKTKKHICSLGFYGALEIHILLLLLLLSKIKKYSSKEKRENTQKTNSDSNKLTLMKRQYSKMPKIIHILSLLSLYYNKHLNSSVRPIMMSDIGGNL